MNEVVTKERSQRAAAGSGVVCQFDLLGTRYALRLIRITHQSVNDHVRTFEIAEFVCKHIQSNEGAEIGSFPVLGHDIDAVEIDASYIVGKHLRVVVLEVCRFFGIVVFVPRRRSCGSEELGSGNKEIGVQCETLLSLLRANEDVEGALDIQPD